jgi:uncharacterized membrane protein YkvA (DUF1232 family)
VTWWQWGLVARAVTVLLWAVCVAALVLLGRRSQARALAGFIPDCLVLFRRLLADGRVPRSRKLVLVALLAYLALPFDLIPDFIPVVGALDDAIVVALALRYVLRAAGAPLVREHWPGPPDSLDAIMRLAFGRADEQRTLDELPR